MATGLLLPGLVFAVLGSAHPHRRVGPGSSERQLGLLQAIPLFARLPPAALEHLAANLVRVTE
jgi:hypothetical protein